MSDVAIIVQARMGSSRLPGKVLKDIHGMPLIEILLRRLERAEARDLIVATTEQPEDDILVDVCAGLGVKVARGSTHDVLARYVTALDLTDANIVCRVTGDVPFLDPAVVRMMMAEFDRQRPDWLGFRSVPCVGAELFPVERLLQADREATAPNEREHVSPYLYTRPELFNAVTVEPPADIVRPYPLSVDVPAELEQLRDLADALTMPILDATVHDMIAVLDSRPDIVAMTDGIQKRTYEHSSI